MMQALTPAQIVRELDRFIIGQTAAKRCVAIALRNRWRRLQLPSPLREEILPKNILMIGPTGVGKTEIARRLARLVQAPFIKVEATKFTEIGYVGRDVEQIIRDLMEVAIHMTRESLRQEVEQAAQAQVEQRLLQALVGEGASGETKEKFLRRLQAGELEEGWVEISVSDSKPTLPTLDFPGLTGVQGIFHLGDLLGKSTKTKIVRMMVKEARRLVLTEESDKLLDQERVIRQATEAVEQNGIVFIDEIDKICARARHGEVSREGVQRDLLPLLGGTTVSTKYGMVRTDHILFIASGAFHVAKPADLLPELQGRLPIRVELQTLTEADFVRILNEPENSLIRQYQALLSTESVELHFTPEAIQALAKLAVEVNTQVENIGARRLHTILERLLEDLSFDAPDRVGQTYTIDQPMALRMMHDLVKDPGLSRFVL